MKKIALILPLCAATVCLSLSGCSKSKNAATTSGSGGNAADATLASGASDKPVDMRIKWTVGKKYPIRIEMAQSTKTDVPDQAEPVTQNMELTQGFDISALKETDDGGRQLELKFATEKMDVSQGDRS